MYLRSKIQLLLLAFSLSGVTACGNLFPAKSASGNTHSSEAMSGYKTLLKSEGYAATVDKDGDLEFSVSETQFYLDTSDTEYFGLFAAYGTPENDINNALKLAVNHMNLQQRWCKVGYKEGSQKNQLLLSIEQYTAMPGENSARLKLAATKLDLCAAEFRTSYAKAKDGGSLSFRDPKESWIAPKAIFAAAGGNAMAQRYLSALSKAGSFKGNRFSDLSIDSDGDVRFTYGGNKGYISVDESTPNYQRIVMQFDTSGANARTAMARANTVNNIIKIAKVSVRTSRTDEVSYNIASEQYLYDNSNVADYLHAGARAILAGQSKLVEVEEGEAQLNPSEPSTLRASLSKPLQY